MAISQKGIQNISSKLQSEKIDRDSREGKLGLTDEQKIIYELNQYKKDPISYREKYGDKGIDILLQRVNDLRVKQESNKKGGRIKYQYGGMADMSAAPMVQPRKKKKQSGFRTKYSKGGGVRATKYKI